MYSYDNCENIEKNDNSQLIKCERCEKDTSEFFCENCIGIKYMCRNCDKYLHALNSKREHNRKEISQYNEILFKRYIFYKKSQSTLYKSDGISSNKTHNNYNSLHNNNNNGSETKYRNIFDSNNITKLYKENDELNSKIHLLENTISNLKDKYQIDIRNLQMQLEDFHRKEGFERKIKEEEYIFELKRVVYEKDEEIKYIKEKNQELSIGNVQLLQKCELYINLIQDMKFNFNENITKIEIEIQKYDTELSEMKTFYENQIASNRLRVEEEHKSLIDKHTKDIEE